MSGRGEEGDTVSLEQFLLNVLTASEKTVQTAAGKGRAGRGGKEG